MRGKEGETLDTGGGGADRQTVSGKKGETLDTVGGRQTDSEGEGGRDTRHSGGQTDRE